MDSIEKNLPYLSMKLFWDSVKCSSAEDLIELVSFIDLMLENKPDNIEQGEADIVIHIKEWVVYRLEKRREMHVGRAH